MAAFLVALFKLPLWSMPIASAVACVTTFLLWWLIGRSLACGRKAAAILLACCFIDASLIFLMPLSGILSKVVAPHFLGITIFRLLVSLTAGSILLPLSFFLIQAVRRSSIPLFIALQAIVSLCELYALHIEPYAPRVSRLSLPQPQLFPDRPLRIVHLSDLHMERTTRRERRILSKLAKINPDLIVLTGDYRSVLKEPHHIALKQARSFLSKLHAPYGVYATLSGIEQTDEIRQNIFSGLDIKLLEDEVQEFDFEKGHLSLIGISQLRGDRDGAAMEELVPNLSPDDFSILLYHTPYLIRLAAERQMDLYLCGHTHGGQVRLPLFDGIASDLLFPKPSAAGRYTFKKTTLYINRGVGFGAWLRARFLCPPEILLVTVGRDPTSPSPPGSPSQSSYHN